MINLLAALQTVVSTALAGRLDGLRREHGLETVEYALIAALIAVVAITTITALGTEVKATFDSILNAINPGASTTTN